MVQPRSSIIAHHLIFTGYGHWLPNDLRGSGSTEIRKPELHDLGAIHHGRKRVQPPREELRAFHQQAAPLLDHPVIWFDDAKRQALAQTFGQTIERNGYICYACAACSNHAHLIIRVHRNKGDVIWEQLATASRLRLRDMNLIALDHPLWSARPYAVFLKSPERVRACIAYVHDNPLKEGLPAQAWDFVQPYDNWPHHKTR